MAITFNPIEKIIQLDTFTVSERELWTEFVNWSVLSDNLKYGVGMTQIGGAEPIALYIYLELGWKIRPMEADGITTITGNVLVQGGGSPITPTVGNWQTLVNMETPVKASAIEVGGSSLTPIQGRQLEDIDKLVDELHKLQGLNKSHPMTVTPSKRTVDNIDLTISGDGENVSVVTRE